MELDTQIDKPNKHSGIISYFAHNPVAANLLMVFIIVVGLFSAKSIQRQIFPQMEIPWITVSAYYPGASPQEIEEGVILRIEDSLSSITEIEQIRATARRSSASVWLRVKKNQDINEVVDKVKSRIDSISSFPRGMEPVRVEAFEIEMAAIDLVVTGSLPHEELKPIARSVERELLQLNNVSLINFSAPSDEIAIEVKPERLQQYGITIADVVNAISRTSNNISAGQIRSNSGLISIRMENRAYTGDEFRNIPVKYGANGALVTVQDVADVRDGFVEGRFYSKYSGKNAIYLGVKSTKTQDLNAVVDSVQQYIEQRNPTLGPDVKIEVIVDLTYYLDGRLMLMLENLMLGAVLVAIMLTIFLRFKVAMWVMVGLPVCFLGCVMFLPLLGVSINLASLFAFIMVLGIVVDDAIVIGESIYTETEKRGNSVDVVIDGAKRVAKPATFGVLTTIAVFAPFLFASGPAADFFSAIAAVAVFCLIFSLIESKLILPAHLAQVKYKPLDPNGWRARFNRAFQQFVYGRYKNFVQTVISYRWATLMVFVSLMMISIAMLSANHVRFVGQPKVPHDFLELNLEMVETASYEQTVDTIRQVEAVIMEENEQIIREFGRPIIKDALVVNQGRTDGLMLMPLVGEDERPMDTFELSKRIRERMPKISGVNSIFIKDDVNGSEEGGFRYVFYGDDLTRLNQAAKALVTELQNTDGLFDVSSSIDPASKEIRMELKPVAYDLGLTLQDIASQTSYSFYGSEAQRFIRNSEEVRVMVKYPELTRRQVADLKYTVIRTNTGAQVMLGDVVDFVEAEGINDIRRVNAQRAVTVWGNIDDTMLEPGEVTERIREEVIPEILKDFPMVSSELGQNLKEREAEQNEMIIFAIIAALMVYILLAVPLKSYSQPLIVMSVIPFGFTGALFGHYLMGLDLSDMSMFGLIAAAGVVINDSLVMTDFINKRLESGYKLYDAVVDAGCARFRAITLTSITTFVGVMPLLFETSLQAKFLVPMAVGLGFAVLFATFVTLLLVPCLYMIFIDFSNTRKAGFAFVAKHLTRVFKRTAAEVRS